MAQKVLIGPWRRAGVVASWRWQLWTLLFSTLILTLMRIGAYWDVQWHWVVGRDTFFIPPHDLIYSGVAFSGLLSLLMLWRFGAAPSYGWLIQLLGVGMLLSAAPFDELWHRRYGIDVTIWSPPHMVGVFGAWVVTCGLFALWTTEWRAASNKRWALVALGGMAWATTLLVSLFNFGLVPAVRWSVLQPATPVLYSALGSILLPFVYITLVWVTGRPLMALVVFLGLVALRLFDGLVWDWSVRYVVPAWGQHVRTTDFSTLNRHFWMHPLLNIGPSLMALIWGSVWSLRRRVWGAVLAGVSSGLAIVFTVWLLSSGRFVHVAPFRTGGRTGLEFQAETSLLLSILGTNPWLALLWGPVFGALSGVLAYLVVQLLRRAQARAIRQAPGAVVKSAHLAPAAHASKSH